MSNETVSKEEFEALKNQVEALSKLKNNTGVEDRMSLVMFSGSLDKLLAGFIMATSAAASGMEVSIFFTFWGYSAIKKEGFPQPKKGFLEKCFGWMLPRGSKELPLSQLNMAGAGPILLRHMMKSKGAASLEDLISVAAELGVKFSVCDMTRDLMGVDPSEIIDYPHMDYCGVTQFVESASSGKVTLFI